MASSTEQSRSPLRVCILAEANPLIWVHHYVQAFREHCDVLTVGPSLTAADLAQMGKPHLAHLLYANDIDARITDAEQLEAILPTDWRPNLVVTVQSGYGCPSGLPGLRCPTAYISVDTWHSPMEYVYARHHEFVFAAQREFLPLFQATGSRHVRWLPLAFSPSAHHPVAVEKDLDIAFVGSCGRRVHEQRRARMTRLATRFKVDVDDGLCAEDMCRMLARGRLVFNSSIAGDVNMRVFEALGMGATLLTDRAAAANGLMDLFNDGEHLVTYDDEDLLNVAHRYLEDADARERIALAGRQLVLHRDTYWHRVQTILDTVGEMIPNFHEGRDGLVRKGGVLRDHIPTAPGALADLGLGLGASKYALRRFGSTKCIGVTRDAEEAHRRAGSYDEMIVLDSGTTAGPNVDTAVLTNPAGLTSPEKSALDIAYSLLRSGGTLLAALTSEESNALGIDPRVDGYAKWVETHGFIFLAVDTLVDPANGRQTVAVTARKRTKTVRQAATEVYSRQAMPNMTLEQFLATIPASL